jgi:hypothetical protein
MQLRTLLIGMLVPAIVLGADASEYVLVVRYDGMQTVDLKGLQVSAAELGYESAAAVLGLRTDLNNDGVQEHVLRGGLVYCGTGGCTITVVDGKSGRKVASVFGRPLLVHSARINGWPVLSTYWHLGATSGYYSTFVYDGQRYERVSQVMLYDKAIKDLFEALEKVPSVGDSR